MEPRDVAQRCGVATNHMPNPVLCLFDAGTQALLHDTKVFHVKIVNHLFNSPPQFSVSVVFFLLSHFSCIMSKNFTVEEVAKHNQASDW